MKKSRFSESQIVGILKEADSGVKVQDIWRKYNISSATYYKWKSKYGGMEVSDVKRLKELEGENRRLKQMYADLSLENHALKDLIEKSFKATREEGSGRVSGGRAQAYGEQGLRLYVLIQSGLLQARDRLVGEGRTCHRSA